MPQAFYILFGAAFTVLVSLALGKMLLRWTALKLYRQEEHALALAVGAAVLSALMFALCAVHLVYKGVLLALGLLILAAAYRMGVHRATGESLPPLDRFWRWVFWPAFAAFTVLYFFNAMAPEFSADGVAYHLGFVSRYVRVRGFERITTNMYANLSQGIELLYTAAFTFGRHSAAALVHFAFLFTLPLAMLAYARRIGWPGAGVCGALLVYASPVFGIDGTTSYNDVAVAFIAFALFYLLQIWMESDQPDRAPDRAMVAIGLVAGFGYAAKYTAFVGVPYAIALVIWKLRRIDRRVIVLGLCAAAMIAPWMLKNWIWLDNPVSPFFNRLFPNPYIFISFEDEYRHHMQNYGLLRSHWDIPLEVTVRGIALTGLLGPVFLLAPLGLAALRSREGRQLWLAALVFGITYATNIGTRFLIPATPFVALAMGSVFTWSARWKLAAAALVLAHAIASWPSVLKRCAPPGAWRLERIPLKQALRIESEESYLNFKLPTYGTARTIERLVPPGEKVFTFSQVPEAYTSREILVAYQSALGNILAEVLWTPVIEPGIPTWRLRFAFPEQKLKHVRVVQTASGGPDHWSISEMRVFRGGRELERRPEWRLRAKPNPWGVRRAFDNAAITRWRSFHVLFPGMFVEVDFGREESVDAVLLECSPDQYKIKLKLEGMNGRGEWKTLTGEPEISEAAVPLGLRRAATEELKANGVRYVMAYDYDYGADDFRTKTALWGLKLLHVHGQSRLYKIE